MAKCNQLTSLHFKGLIERSWPKFHDVLSTIALTNGVVVYSTLLCLQLTANTLRTCLEMLYNFLDRFVTLLSSVRFTMNKTPSVLIV